MARPTFRFRQRNRDLPVLTGQRINLRVPRLDNYEQWATIRRESRDFLEPWEPRWPSDDLTREAYRQRVRRYDADRLDGLALPFFIFLNDDDALAGGVTIGAIRRGASESCTLGYWMGEKHAGNGLMADAVGLIIPHIFRRLRLHRIEAACIPENERSSRLLEKAGFRQEGYLRGYLRINGAWRDHLLYAMTIEDWEARQAAMKAVG